MQKDLFNVNNLRKDMKWRIIGLTGKYFLDALMSTTQISFHAREQVEPLIKSQRVIYAFWHSRIIPVSYTHQKYNAAIMVSQSKDGEIIAQVIYRQGQEPIRGSTTRGGREALHDIANTLISDIRPGAIIPDGPVGPRCKVKPGIIKLAQMTGHHIIPLTGSTSHMAILNSWDKFVVPRPFSRCLILYGNPIHVPADASKEQLESHRYQLEHELNRITNRVDNYFGHNIR
ncbi:hypothetical protein MHK_007546 [Candidatus Magnetomorum sp. HK-1]|nr:hypothetical protein MHK_007546 [Candidatus Magnetomorum sp. HK-1]